MYRSCNGINILELLSAVFFYCMCRVEKEDDSGSKVRHVEYQAQQMVQPTKNFWREQKFFRNERMQLLRKIVLGVVFVNKLVLM